MVTLLEVKYRSIWPKYSRFINRPLTEFIRYRYLKIRTLLLSLNRHMMFFVRIIKKSRKNVHNFDLLHRPACNLQTTSAVPEIFGKIVDLVLSYFHNYE